MKGTIGLLTLAITLGTGVPSRAATNGAIEINEQCAGPNEAGLAETGCLCDLGFFWNGSQCLRPGFGTVRPGFVVVDECGFFGCGGGGNGGGGTPPVEEDACTIDTGSVEMSCTAADDTCTSTFDAEAHACGTAEGAVAESCTNLELPPGVICDLESVFGMIGGKPALLGYRYTCQGNGLPSSGFSADPRSLCRELWIDAPADDLEELKQSCVEDAQERLGSCREEVAYQCADCATFHPPLFALAPPLEPETVETLATLGWLRARVRTHGQTVIGPDAWSRTSSRSTCFWQLFGDGGALVAGVLHCPAGNGFAQVGEMFAEALDDGRYAATGSCGIATPTGTSRGEGAFVLDVAPHADGTLRRVKLRSISGAISGTLDGVHAYRGDCDVRGRLVDEADVPVALRDGS